MLGHRHFEECVALVCKVISFYLHTFQILIQNYSMVIQSGIENISCKYTAWLVDSFQCMVNFVIPNMVAQHATPKRPSYIWGTLGEV